MKIFVISDIHGSLFYLKKALEAFERERADYILILGDILYHGPRNPLPEEYNPKEVAGLLNGYKEKIISVRGNCDSEVDQMMLEFPIMSDYSNIIFERRRIFATHGHHFNMEKIPSLQKGDILIYGHTHIPFIAEKEGIILLNPGSVALPKENSPHSYGIFEKNSFKIKDLEGKVYKERELS